MLKLIKYLKPYTLLICLIFVLVYIQSSVNLQLPDYMARIVNEGIVKQNQDLILNTGLEMLLITLIGASATVGVGFLAARVGSGVARDLRDNVFRKIEEFSLPEFNKFSTASLITRSTNDIGQVQIVLTMMFRMVLSAPIMAVGAVIKAYHLAPSMSWIMALAVITLLAVIITVMTLALPKFALIQKVVDKLNLVSRQILTGLRVIRAFNTESFEEKKFEEVNTQLTRANLFVNRVTAVMQPTMLLIFNITAITIIWVGAHQIELGNLMIGDMIAFMQYATQVIMAFLMISIIFIMVPRAAVSGDRIAEVLSTDPSIKDPPAPKNLTKDSKAIIKFEEVTFAYPGADLPVLHNISFIAKPGEVTAFIGSTGSGKSTLINLIPRFYDVSLGRITIDGIDIRDLRQKDLHDLIGYVPQKGLLFSGTINSNIQYGKKDAHDNQIQSAATIAQANDFIQKFAEKYNSPISQGGTNVSGGQKQRLSIARAVVKEPKIYIFDDSFSALDFKTDAALRKALSETTKDSTVLIVAQRIGTIINADQIIVLDEGKIVGKGTHQELMKTCSVYKEIALSQLSEEELNQQSNTNSESEVLS